MAHTKLGVELPFNIQPVLVLLGDWAEHARRDAARYCRDNHQPESAPAAQDRLDLADSLKELAAGLRRRSAERWRAFHAGRVAAKAQAAPAPAATPPDQEPNR